MTKNLSISLDRYSKKINMENKIKIKMKEHENAKENY